MEVFAVVRKCFTVSSKTITKPTINISVPYMIQYEGLDNLQVDLVALQLTCSIQRVAILHKCSTLCKYSDDERTVRDSESVRTGGTFLALSRPIGYPPRTA